MSKEGELPIIIGEPRETVVPGKDAFVVPTKTGSSDYLLQLPVSCLPTSVLNGLIYQGQITRDQAQVVNQELLKYGDSFGRRQLLKFERTTSILVIKDMIRSATGLKVDFQAERFKGFSGNKLERLLEMNLRHGNVFVGPLGPGHVALYVGYDKEKFFCIDPSQPQILSSEPKIVASVLFSGSPDIPVIPKRKSFMAKLIPEIYRVK
ncbi:MAG: hypothetical protein Q7K54_03935 [Candidatus Parcubacteria bacterium]|nr:hypothetical protein [Candidatus Parcubacteria bacterium]